MNARIGPQLNVAQKRFAKPIQDYRTIIRTDMSDLGWDEIEFGQSGPVGEIPHFPGLFPEQLFGGPMGYIEAICLPQKLEKIVAVEIIGQETAHFGRQGQFTVAVGAGSSPAAEHITRFFSASLV